MLSATPFKPFTNEFDELNGESHYSDFLDVLKFLLPDRPDTDWADYEKKRSSFFHFIRHPQKLKSNEHEVQKVKEELEDLYRSAMVRTEKMLVSKEKDAMIERMESPIPIQLDDINDFVALDQITQYLNQNHGSQLAVPLEYVKSCPFALSFLDNYQHKEKLRSSFPKDSHLKKLIGKTSQGWINTDRIKEYKPIIPQKGTGLPNAKLRLLLEQTVANGGWKYLWVPPSLPYYSFQGAFKNSDRFSKTLIFSSWKMVPKMISTIVSYEAERYSVGNPNSISKQEGDGVTRKYFEKRRSPRPQFVYRSTANGKEPGQMNNFSVSYPCIYLATFYDPVENLAGKKNGPWSGKKDNLKIEFWVKK